MVGGNPECLDASTLDLIQQPPQSPMIGTLIAPLAVLFTFYVLEGKGNGAAATQHLSKLFHLSSMPREYIPLLTAEMLPILDRTSPLGNVIDLEKTSGSGRRICLRFWLRWRITWRMTRRCNGGRIC
jgi:Nup85 Nucleoporin